MVTAKCGEQGKRKRESRVFRLATGFSESWSEGTSSEAVQTQLTRWCSLVCLFGMMVGVLWTVIGPLLLPVLLAHRS